MTGSKKDESEDWLTEGLKKFLKFMMSATPDELREFLREAHYEECTGINPDTIEIHQYTAGELQKMQAEYDAL